MGLSKGHTFTDGETVTAAKLNNLVDNATITSDTVTTAMIQDNAVTADKLATDAVTGANIASNSINLTSLSNASGGTSGTIVQSGAGGVFEEFTPGTSGTFLKSAGTDASLTWGTVDATGVDATMISGHTEITSPGTDDILLVKDKAAGVNKSLQIQNLYKTVSGLTALSSADIANPDQFLVLDGGIPKKISHADLEASLVTAVQASITTSTFYQIDEIYVTGGELKNNGIAAMPFMSSTVGGVLTPLGSGITDTVYQPFEITYGGIGTAMPHAGEVVKIQATHVNWGSTHFGGAVEVIRIDPNGIRTNNSILLSHAIPSGVSKDTTSTTFTSGNSFTADTVLGVRLYGSNTASTPHLRVLITYKFTA